MIRAFTFVGRVTIEGTPEGDMRSLSSRKKRLTH
jgi:hypothetical protein